MHSRKERLDILVSYLINGKFDEVEELVKKDLALLEETCIANKTQASYRMGEIIDKVTFAQQRIQLIIWLSRSCLLSR